VKKFGMVLGLTVFACATLLTGPAFAKKGEAPDLMKLCKKECPDASDMKAVMECVEKKEYAEGPDAAKFKKTKCFITHEKFEDKYKEMAGMKHEESEESEKK
jgi:hypothetical protein